jgi:mitogen-activated protein kinase kinase 3
LLLFVKIDLQVLYDPSPTPPKDKFSPEFCSFVDACLQKDADKRPTADDVYFHFNLIFFCSLRNTSVRTYGLIYILKIIMQLLHHPFIKKYEKVNVELSAYIRTIVDPKQRLKEIADVSLSSHFSIFLHSNLSQVIRTFPLSIPCG